MQTHVEKVTEALKGVQAAEEKARAVIHKLFPVGSDVKWERGGHVHYGTVTMLSSHNAGQNIRVRNMYTQKEYWISFYNIQCAHAR